MIFNKNCRIGIWGFGITGKAAVNYLHIQGYIVGVMDKRMPTTQELAYLTEKNISWYTEKESDLFFNCYEFVLLSSGVNVSPTCYATYKNKWLHELDFFSSVFNKPIIAVTGSVGKTSITHILGQIFKIASIPVAIGGNIGIPTFDLIHQQEIVDYALLEVSSFQLNYCKNFAPNLAIWTNFHPNHLDYHIDEQNYFLAKNNILRSQTNNQFSLISFTLRDKVTSATNHHKRSYFASQCPKKNELKYLTPNEQVYYLNKENNVMRYAHDIHTLIMDIPSTLLNFSFIENIILLVAACDILKINPEILTTVACYTQLPEHRLEKINDYNTIEFYNDSKATTTASTLAAVEKLKNQLLHIFIGGLSKGVDRALFIMQLKKKVQHIYCFGHEASELYMMSINNGISASYHKILDDAVNHCFSLIKPGDCVLLSPAGSSYDLYTNYEERGNHFKLLVTQFIQKHSLI